MIVAKVAEDPEVPAERCAFALRNAGGDDGASLDHRAFLSAGQSADHRRDYTEYLDQQRFDADHPRHFHAIQIALHQRHSTPRRDRLKVQNIVIVTFD